MRAVNDIVAELAQEFWRTRASGVIVTRESVDSADWQARVSQCHWNVASWTRRNPIDRAVYGCFVLDWSFGTPPRYDFLLHSVIQRPAGMLVDITPQPPEDPGLIALAGPSAIYPFVPFYGPAEKFAVLVAAGVARIEVQGTGNKLQLRWTSV